MAKHYVFYREDIINLLMNHKHYIAQKGREVLARGESLKSVTNETLMQWTAEFFDQLVEKGEIKLEHILDEVDEILKHTHGMTTLERAKQKKEEN